MNPEAKANNETKVTTESILCQSLMINEGGVLQLGNCFCCSNRECAPASRGETLAKGVSGSLDTYICADPRRFKMQMGFAR